MLNIRRDSLQSNVQLVMILSFVHHVQSTTYMNNHYKHVSLGQLTRITRNLSYVIEKGANFSIWWICIVHSPT